MRVGWFTGFVLAIAFALSPTAAHAGGSITVAAAADLQFAMNDIVTAFRQAHPADRVDVIYGSSGQFYTQIRQRAPFDLYFSADIAYPQALVKAGLAASVPRRYAIGRIVLWSATLDASKLRLQDLADPRFDRIAIANPEHAPYGKRAQQALQASGVWGKVRDRLVYGENIAQTAQFVQTGNARIGIIALSLAMNPAFAARGGYALIPADLHDPLEQGYVITRRAANNPLALAFARFIESPQAKAILQRYGFSGTQPTPAHEAASR
ncbi:MAG: molybdate ABC transporter substrate-binding protein [Rhodanobacter sp.]|jgi:molybdate transport system substrate-binding protein|nr:molybdate ABC transporter substrate-binding protein [Rhodanobacter sp.]